MGLNNFQYLSKLRLSLLGKNQYYGFFGTLVADQYLLSHVLFEWRIISWIKPNWFDYSLYISFGTIDNISNEWIKHSGWKLTWALGGVTPAIVIVIVTKVRNAANASPISIGCWALRSQAVL